MLLPWSGHLQLVQLVQLVLVLVLELELELAQAQQQLALAVLLEPPAGPALSSLTLS